MDVNPFDPIQDQVLALLELAFKVTIPPLHIVPLFAAPVDDGTAFTETIVVYTVEGLQPLPKLLTVSE